MPWDNCFSLSTCLLFPLYLCGFLVTLTAPVLHVLKSVVLLQTIQTPIVLYVLQQSFILYGCPGCMLGILIALDVMVTAVLFTLWSHMVLLLSPEQATSSTGVTPQWPAPTLHEPSFDERSLGERGQA